MPYTKYYMLYIYMVSIYIYIHVWVVVKITVPFEVLHTVRHLIFRGLQKGP